MSVLLPGGTRLQDEQDFQLLKQIPAGTRFGHQVTISLARSESRHDGKPSQVLVDVRCDCGSDRLVLVKPPQRRQHVLRMRQGSPRLQGAVQAPRALQVLDQHAREVLDQHARAVPEPLWIDRIDPGAGCRPANCRWITAREDILRAGRILHDEDENRMTALRARTGQSVADIAELALDAFLPPLQGTPS